MDAAAAERLDGVVERPHALHGAEREPLRERAVAVVEPVGRGAERPVRVRVVLEDPLQNPERRRAGGAHRSPRSHASYSMRRPLSG